MRDLSSKGLEVADESPKSASYLAAEAKRDALQPATPTKGGSSLAPSEGQLPGKEVIQPISPEAPVAPTEAGAPGANGPAAGLAAKLEAKAEAARKRIEKRGTLKGTRLSAGVPVEDMADFAIYGAAKIAKGVVEFSKWSAEMIADFGEQIKPALQELFARAKAYHEENAAPTAERFRGAGISR